MFDVNDREYIVDMIRKKKPDAFVIPLYVKVYNQTYTMHELNTIPNFNPSGFRVGFGAVVSMFDRYSLPQDKMFRFECIDAFNVHNEKYNADEKFIVIEIGIFTDDDQFDENDPVYEQLGYYYNLLREYLNHINKEKRRRMIEEQMKEQAISE